MTEKVACENMKIVTGKRTPVRKENDDSCAEKILIKCAFQAKITQIYVKEYKEGKTRRG